MRRTDIAYWTSWPVWPDWDLICEWFFKVHQREEHKQQTDKRHKVTVTTIVHHQLQVLQTSHLHCGKAAELTAVISLQQLLEMSAFVRTHA